MEARSLGRGQTLVALGLLEEGQSQNHSGTELYTPCDHGLFGILERKYVWAKIVLCKIISFDSGMR